LNWCRADLKKKQKPEAKHEFICIKFQYFFMVKITIKPKDAVQGIIFSTFMRKVVLFGEQYDNIY
jgi:hypothetical protein